MKKGFVKRALAVMIVLAMTLSLCSCGSGEAPSGSEGASSEVTASQPEAQSAPEETKVEARTAIVFSLGNGSDDGEVDVVRGGESQKAYEGMRLTVGDIVITDFLGFAYLRIDDDKNILLDKSSTMEITEMTNGNLLLSLIEGEFFFDVQNKLADGEKMAFAIGGATMSIRGTSGGGSSRNGVESFYISSGIGYLEPGQTEGIELLAGDRAESNDTGDSFNTSSGNGPSALEAQYQEMAAENDSSESSSSEAAESSSSSSSVPQASQSQASSSSSSSEESDSSDVTESLGNLKQVTIRSGGDGGSTGGFMGFTGEPALMPCGHAEGTAGNHSLLACGLHYACSVEGDISIHQTKITSIYSDSGETAECGHYECQANDMNHAVCDDCLGFFCDGNDHSICTICYDCLVCNPDHEIYTCGVHCNGQSAWWDYSHTMCGVCGNYDCDGSWEATNDKPYQCKECGMYFADVKESARA